MLWRGDLSLFLDVGQTRDDDAVDVYKMYGYCPAQVISKRNKKRPGLAIFVERLQFGIFKHWLKNWAFDCRVEKHFERSLIYWPPNTELSRFIDGFWKATWSNDQRKGFSIVCGDFYLDTEIQTVEIAKSSGTHQIIWIILEQY